MSEPTHDPGDLPRVLDEAGDTPSWVPLLGLGLLALITLFVVYRVATAAEETDVAEASEAAASDQDPAGE